MERLQTELIPPLQAATYPQEEEDEEMEEQESERRKRNRRGKNGIKRTGSADSN